MLQNPVAPLLEKLEAYKRKFFLNRLLKGGLFTLATLLTVYLGFNAVEYFGNFGRELRTILFFSFLLLFVSTLFFWVLKPLYFLFIKQKPLSNQEAAQQIGRFFPEVGDKLVNTLQLASISEKDNSLLMASIEQKSRQLAFVRFSDAVQLEKNRPFLKYVAIPGVIILGLLAIWPSFFTKPTSRIVNFSSDFQPEAPFSFLLENKNLQAFKNEDFIVNLQLQGNAIPDAVYLEDNGRKLKMETTDGKTFSYTFRKVQEPFSFAFHAAGFNSNSYDLSVVERPHLSGFEVELRYPGYLNRPNESLENAGNLSVPEGTTVSWRFNAQKTDSVRVVFDTEKRSFLAEKNTIAGDFSLARQAKVSSGYQVSLFNEFAANREPISYYLNVIPDKFPGVSLEQYRDSTLYNFLVLGGNISDDYGISGLRVFYRVLRQDKDAPKVYSSVPLPFDKNQSIQSFYYNWATDSLKMNPGDKLEYYVSVADNDGVNGPKSTKTGLMTYAVPSKRAIEKEIDNAIDKTEAQLDKSLNKAQQLKKELTALEARLRNKRELDFQDKKQVEELIKKREQLMQELQQMQQQNQALNEKQQRFNEQKPELAQKFEQLQKLMDELMKNDNEKLYDQLKEMLEKNQDERLLEMLDKLKAKEKNTEKDLDRALNLFKKLQREQKLDKAIDQLQKLADKQEDLADKNEKKDAQENGKKDPKANDKKQDAKKADDKKTDDKKSSDDKNADEKKGDDKKADDKASPEDKALKKEQEKLQQEMEDVKKDLKDVEELNKDLKDQQSMDTGKPEQEEISEEQEKSKEDTEKGDNASAAKKQKRASKQMRNLAQKLSAMKMDGEMKENEENMDDLRDILENLVTLSFDQERLMNNFKGVQLSDPRFVKLAQEQIKLQDDSKIIEDSLYALSRRVLQIQSFVTRELTDMKKNMDDAAKFIKERKIGYATSKQQFAMTNVNNLAMMLSEVLQQMQQNQMDMAAAGSGKGKKKKGNTPTPGMGKMQEQMNQEMQKTMQEGKGGKGMSQQLAKLAAQQATIRRQLQEALDKQKGTETGKKLSNEVNELMKKMDQTEEDLVNKRLNPTLINRNKEILTRLLESEKAMQEQEEEQKRKAETAREVPRKVPPAFEKYVQDKQKQTEMLRTVPPSISPFYKREIDQYFKRLR